MLTTSAAKIYLASKRRHVETECFRSFHTFNFGQPPAKNKETVEPLYVLNDETLAGGQSIQLSVEEDSLVMLLPVVGGIVIRENCNGSNFVPAGQVHMLCKKAGSKFELHNPYNEALVNYLQLWFRCSAVESAPACTFCFTLNSRQNNMIPLFPTVVKNNFYLHAVIGKFNGRGETTYQLSSEKHKVMAFIIEGAFELENRLLESRDGLAIWNTSHIEIEALSNEAIILLIKLG